MSHFTVMVQVPKEEFIDVHEASRSSAIEQYVEKVLAPFNEQDDNYCVYEIESTRQELEEEFEERKQSIRDNPESYLGRIQNGTDDSQPQIDILGMSLEEFIAWYYEGEKFDEEGNLLRYYNPNAKWDWWVIGGRWSGLLFGKDGENHDILQVKDIDFKGMNERDAIEAGESYDAAMAEKDMNKGIRHFLYGIKPGMTREEYVAKHSAGLRTFAVLDKDEEWHEKGQMGWFGMSSATEEDEKNFNDSFYDNFIKPLDPEDAIVIVDCHI